MALNNGVNVNNTSLSEQIKELSFVKTELELYLDTHPKCTAALDYYDKTVAELNALTERYENTVGPITAAGVKTQNGWTWIETPWPWQAGNGAVKEDDK